MEFGEAVLLSHCRLRRPRRGAGGLFVEDEEVAAVAGGPNDAIAGPEPMPSEGLQKTEHVKKFHESARF